MTNFFKSLLLFLIVFPLKTLLLTPEERKQFLDIHNHLRRAVTPQASNMQELVYNETIENVVNGYLEQCRFEHRKLDGFGENGRLATDKNITDTVMSWFQERVYFNYFKNGSSRCSQENSKFEYLSKVECGHYKMMVRGTLASLGCGYKLCKSPYGDGITYPESYITFCFYNAGQMDRPYEIGKPCTGCEQGYLFCYRELCVPADKYFRNQTSCELKCLNCATFFSKKSCLCDCPSNTEAAVCRGNINNPSCTTCQKKALSCNNGEEVSVDNNCTCKCTKAYQGEYCNVRIDKHEASYHHVIDGTKWRYNMSVPINIFQFKNSYEKFQTVIALDIFNFCLTSSSTKQCSEIVTYSINQNDVLLLPESPIILENGSLSIEMFVNYSIMNEIGKQEKFVPPFILSQIWNSPSPNLQSLVENIKRIYPEDLDFNFMTTDKSTESTLISSHFWSLTTKPPDSSGMNTTASTSTGMNTTTLTSTGMNTTTFTSTGMNTTSTSKRISIFDKLCLMSILLTGLCS